MIRRLSLSLALYFPGLLFAQDASTAPPADTLKLPSFRTDSRLTLGTQANRSAAVRTGDVDNDGDLDLVVANGRHWPQQNFLFLNQGRGRFNVARRLGEPLETSYVCELGDLNGDGDLDVVVGNDLAPSVVLLGDGKGIFTPHFTLGTPSSVRSITLADVDADGDLDVLMSCRGQENQIHFNNGQAKFPDVVKFGGKRDSTIDVAVADVNEDGKPDLILANRDSQPNVILTGRGQGKFEKPLAFGNPRQSSRSVVIGDFNQDQHVDWAIGNLGSPNELFLGDGKGGIADQITIQNVDSQTYAMAVADMDGDGQPDIVCGNVRQPNTVHFNRDLGQRFEVVWFGDKLEATYGICLGDFDGDGDQDISLANSDSLNRIYLNQAPKK